MIDVNIFYIVFIGNEIVQSFVHCPCLQNLRSIPNKNVFVPAIILYSCIGLYLGVGMIVVNK